ncbi:MAG: flagellar biosynthesis protein FlhF [Desulforhopalus sp.]
MQVRIFESPDMTSGLKMIKKELGPDALILSTRTVRNSKMGLLGKPMLEITAAIDPDYPSKNIAQTKQANIRETRATRRPESNMGFQQVVDECVDKYLQPTASSPEESRQTVLSRPQVTASSQGTLQREVDELRTLVASLAGQINTIASSEENQPEKSVLDNETEQFSPPGSNQHTENEDRLISQLLKREINSETAQKIADLIRENFPDSLSNAENESQLIQETIQGLLRTSPPDFQAEPGQHRIALIGPTGVGKTTTLAKIAANYLSNHSGSIALITIDTYRIAAVEQLKVYGEIMHLPVEVVITPDQLQEALNKHRDKELILIDTAGRSPRDNFSIEELASFLKPQFGIEKHLVLSATTRENELVETADRFSRLIVDKTIFTKIDECTNLGVLLNLQMQTSAPLSYITNGQRVPEDLLQVDPKIVAELIMTHYQGPMHE